MVPHNKNMSVCWEPQRRPCTCIHHSEPSTINCRPQTPMMSSNKTVAEIVHGECILFLFQSSRWSIWCSCKWDNWIWPATNWLWRREKPVWQRKVGCAKNTHFYTVLEYLSTWLWSVDVLIISKRRDSFLLSSQQSSNYSGEHLQCSHCWD